MRRVWNKRREGGEGRGEGGGREGGSHPVKKSRIVLETSGGCRSVESGAGERGNKCKTEKKNERESERYKSLGAGGGGKGGVKVRPSISPHPLLSLSIKSPLLS